MGVAGSMERSSDGGIVLVGGAAQWRDILARSGLRVVGVARTIAEGLDAMRAHGPEVTLVGPPVDATEYARRAKADPETQTSHLIALVGSGGSAGVVAALEAGADDGVAAAADTPEVVVRVRAALRLRRLQAERAQAGDREALLSLAATLGHEVNNPLTALFGHLELTLHYLQHNDREKMLHHLQVAGEVASRIAKVTHRLMALAEPRLKSYLGDQMMLDLDLDEQPAEQLSEP